MSALIELKNVEKRFGTNLVFTNVNLQIQKGESVVIVGGSGCGKSTLMRCMNRLIVPEKGEVLFDGQNLLAKETNIDVARRRMGMVYQQFNLFSHLNILENIILAPMKINGVPQADAIKEAEELLRRVGLESHKYHMPNELSGGQKQRAAIARTLAMHPEVIFFDEPTSALDPTMVDEVERVIHSLVDEGLTSILVTHEMRFARNIASRVLFMAEKGIYEDDTPDVVLNDPKKKLTRQFLYKTRMHETEIKKGADTAAICSDFKAFIAKYPTNSVQGKMFPVLFDELILPVLNDEKAPAESVTLTLLCSETSEHHILHVTFNHLENDPLKAPYVDELSAKILEARCGVLFSKQTKPADWDVAIMM